MDNSKNHIVSHIITTLAEDRSGYFNSVAPPIIQTTNFTFERVADFAAALADEYSTHLYSRGRNPTVDILRAKLAALDGADDALVVNSGSTAIFVAVLSQVKSGDHIVAVKGVYSWAQRMFDNILPRFGVATTWIEGSAITNFEQAITAETKLIYLESPTSWFFEEQDIEQVARLARSRNIITIIDNTYYTGLYQQPVLSGIDIVVQSASKYIGGHSDTLGGVISGSAAIIKSIYASEYLNIGAAIMPFNAWLLLRGLRTLPLRLRQLRDSTPLVINFLKDHPAVERILIPRDGFGLFTIILKTRSRQRIVAFCESLKLFAMAVSWGGHEGLVMPGCAMAAEKDFDAERRLHRSVRIYLGLESSEALISDLANAFRNADL